MINNITNSNIFLGKEPNSGRSMGIFFFAITNSLNILSTTACHREDVIDGHKTSLPSIIITTMSS